MSRWNWRAELTEDERATVAKHDAALAKVRAAQKEADATRLDFARIMNRATQRAKYRRMQEAMEATGARSPLKRRVGP